MDFTINHPTETKKVTKLVEVVTEVPVTIGTFRVYPVQYRMYSEGVHIQHKGQERNRAYGFAFTAPGVKLDEGGAVLPSLAGTDAKYRYGTLVVTDSKASILAFGNGEHVLPMASLPAGV